MYATGVLSTLSILKEIAFLKNYWTNFHKSWLHSIAAIDVPSDIFLTAKHVENIDEILLKYENGILLSEGDHFFLLLLLNFPLFYLNIANQSQISVMIQGTFILKLIFKNT